MTLSSAPEHRSLLSVQVLRAVAATSVVICHIVGYEFAIQYKLPDALPTFKFGNAGVDLFFVISGFVMVYSSESLFERANAPREFFLRRLARIVPLYWVTTTIILVYLLVQYRDLARVNFSLAAVVASYLFIPYAQTDGFMAPVHGVGWTLNYEMFFYACFCVALLFSRRKGVVILAVLLSTFVVINLLRPLPNPFGYWTAPLILEFVFGMIIALGLHSRVRIPRAPAASTVVLALLAIAASDQWVEVPRIVAWGVPAALIVAALVLGDFATKQGPLWRGLSFLGDASYSLYLVHPLAITLPRRFFPHFINPATSPWLYAALLLAVALGAAVLVHILFEKPVTRILQRRIAIMFHGERGKASASDLKSLGDQRANM